MASTKGRQATGRAIPVLRDDFVSAVMDMNFQYCPSFDELAPLVAKLPLGRIYSSGKVFIPPIRRPLFDKIEESIAKLRLASLPEVGPQQRKPSLNRSRRLPR